MAALLTGVFWHTDSACSTRASHGCISCRLTPFQHPTPNLGDNSVTMPEPVPLFHHQQCVIQATMHQTQNSHLAAIHCCSCGRHSSFKFNVCFLLLIMFLMSSSHPLFQVLLPTVFTHFQFSPYPLTLCFILLTNPSRI